MSTHIKYNIDDREAWKKGEGMMMEVVVSWPIVNINKTKSKWWQLEMRWDPPHSNFQTLQNQIYG
jgi:hypothetical protein